MVDVGGSSADRHRVQDRPVRSQPFKDAPDGDLAHCPPVPRQGIRTQGAGAENLPKKGSCGNTGLFLEESFDHGMTGGPVPEILAVLTDLR
ncbi:hypothetical protein GCM10027405_05310 [Arthrobacter alkaliphilus]